MKTPRFRERSLHPLSRRLSVWWRRTVRGRSVPEKRVTLVEMDGRPFKRVTFGEAAIAAAVARNLDALERHSLFPRLVAHDGCELLLEFVEGEVAAPTASELARLFGTLYAEDRRRVPIEETTCVAELHRELRFLHEAGVLAEDAWKELDAAADALAPAEVWIGFDYLDPIPRNFVRRPDGRLIAVDVEDLVADALLGGGAVKACLRGGAERGELFPAVERAARLDPPPAWPFVELHFLAGWTARAHRKGIGKLVDPRHFERFRR